MIEVSKSLTGIATGASYGALAKDEHARIAVERAIQKMQPTTVGSVLLFLSTGYAHKPQGAIKNAVIAAGTPQVFGCCAMGLLTEEDWLLDVEGAVAMVFPQEFSPAPLALALQRNQTTPIALCFSSPNALGIAVNSIQLDQFGAVTSDEFGQGPFSVWQSGRINETEFVHSALPENCSVNYAVAQSVKPISPVYQINLCANHSLIELDQQPALESLYKNFQIEASPESTVDQLPFHLLAAVADSDEPEVIDKGQYRLLHVVSFDQELGRIQLSDDVKPGQYLFWATRDDEHAEILMRESLVTVKGKLNSTPKFGLMFPNLSRGAGFYNGRDKDFELFKEAFPGLPLIGFYGHGEIAPGHSNTASTYYYSNVFGIFS